MAFAVDSESELKCAICSQDYQEPRKLPGCTHSFCEYCILTFVQNLKKENKFEHEFECPVCRIPSRIPDNEEINIDWVRKMDKNSEICGRVKADDQDDTTKHCTTCKYLDKAVYFDLYCLNCQESFCKSCSELVHSLKGNNNHLIINIADQQRLNNTHEQAIKMLKSSINCAQHPEQAVAAVCEDHNQLLCVSCAVDRHRICKNLKPIRDLANQCLDKELAKIESSASDLKKHIQTIIDTIKENDAENKNKLDDIRDEIQTIKPKMVQILDALEDKLISDGKALIKEITIKHLDEMHELNSEINTLEQIQYLISNIISELVPYQACACLHELKGTLYKLEKKVNENWSTRIHLSVKLKTTDILDSMVKLELNEIVQLGSVDQTETHVTLPTLKNSISLRKIKAEKQTVYDILPRTEHGDDSTDTPTYNSVVFLPKNDFFLVDSYHGFCCLTDPAKHPIDKCILNKGICDENNYFSNLQYATYLECGLIAVSIPDKMKIYFLTWKGTLSSKMEITFRYRPKAIHGLQNSEIAVCWDEPNAFGIVRFQFCTYSESVYFTQDKMGRKFKSFENMAVDEGRRHVVQPCTVHKAVYCFDFEGQPVFTYTNAALEEPRGVAVDGNGRIYICETRQGGIHVVSPGGLAIQIITEGCPKRPFAIGFSLDCKCFAVTQYDEPYKTVHFYNLVSEEKGDEEGKVEHEEEEVEEKEMEVEEEEEVKEKVEDLEEEAA